ncbi:MAG TPA: glycosyltransferase, partial [Acidimicrobiales bacterium]|nr:glycosyltransferase [Acidimicrobiales bacterium]
PADMPLAIDMYIPTHLENLEAGHRDPESRRNDISHQVLVIEADLRRGDFFLCANERQRNFWLGSLSSAGRVNPANHIDDPTFRSLLDVVPFGVAAGIGTSGGHPLRDAFAAIGPDDPVVVWGGGVYDWLDPLTPVRAVDRARRHVADIRLVFLGMHNPHPAIPEMDIATRLRALSEELGLTGTHVFFNEQWVPYRQWADYLGDADLAVSTHLDHVETRFSSRTRVLDYIGAALPMVLTDGDELTELVAERGLGYAVAPGDDAAVAEALVRLVTDGPPGGDFAALAAELAWPTVAAPLRRWCSAPRRAADRTLT